MMGEKRSAMNLALKNAIAVMRRLPERKQQRVTSFILALDEQEQPIKHAVGCQISRTKREYTRRMAGVWKTSRVSMHK